MSTLLDQVPSVLNLGLSAFGDAIRSTGGEALDLDWRPPMEGDAALGKALARLVNNPVVESANAEAFSRYLNSQPVLEGVSTAGAVIEGLGDRTILHSGPPITWERMAAPVKGAVVGAILYEGWADDPAYAEALAASGEIDYAPCHHYNAVGPMAGMISPSMPVWVVRDKANDMKTYSNLNEGLGKVLRYGAYSPDVIDRLRWMGDTLGPVMAAALEQSEPMELKPLMAQALHMGDEVHNRNVAASALFLKRILPGALRSGLPNEKIAEAAEFIASNDLFYLNISMAACKAMLQAAHNVPNSSMVTVMARNGVEFGIRVSGLGDQWFTAEVKPADGLFFPGYSQADAAPDLGDSAITETAGLGGFAMAAAPAIVRFVGGTPADALAATAEMAHITLGKNTAFTLPSLDFAGTPAGIDIRRVVDNNLAPIINTGIAHKEAGVGQIGAGITRAPMACFIAATAALAGEVGG
ncbi:MAG: DUF1116 domain-containing protein [Proteobacteria bacterium]|nr:DUF1116 domain-containing protein [Pseudomonadota bacterium]